ncbi:MAG TPA: hypothetical protein VJX67_20165 [Blastocatellia bacterium]|nr:hypothetical protein [Blastocatellia bacterium]
MRRRTSWLPFALSAALVFPLFPQGVFAQAQTTPPAASTPTTVRSLKVVPLAGNQEMNDLQNKVMAPLVVQVLDQNDQPIEGADVVFRFPVEGASATFPDQKTAETFRTNADGQASAVGWMANGKVGTFRVQVTASRGAEQGSTVVSMTNVTRIAEAQKKVGQKHWWSTTWGKVAIGAGVAAVVAVSVLATRGSSPRVITVNPGSPSIGGPQ